MRAKQNCGLAL